jgi:two-component sensor histidine kinase
MLTNELDHFNDATGQRIILDGPGVDLAADLAVPLGMALHELTTNALKHGALSTEGGRLSIIWNVLHENATRKLHIDWRETGGPPVEEPTRKGFGSTLLNRVLTVQCNAEVTFDFRPEGLRVQVLAPFIEHRLVPAY